MFSSLRLALIRAYGVCKARIGRHSTLVGNGSAPFRRVLDREKLEARVCECYGVVKKEYDRLLPQGS
jgi:hypothetical protein